MKIILAIPSYMEVTKWFMAKSVSTSRIHCNLYSLEIWLLQDLIKLGTSVIFLISNSYLR